MVFVTGGTGFLGAHLLYHLLEKGESVRALKRKTSKFDLLNRVFSFYTNSPQSIFNKIEWIEGDILDVYSLDKMLEGVSGIYHAAAMVSFQPGDGRNMKNINIKGTANLVNAALDKKIKKLCHVSSIAAIGRAENDKPINEITIWKSSKRNSNYAISKYGAEKEVWRGIEEGLNAIIVNPAIILGPGEISSGTGKMITTVLNGLKFYSTGINGFVDVRDVAKTMIRLMESDITGERFVVSAENLTYKDLFSFIAQYLNKPAPRFEAKQWMGEIAWRIEHIKGLITNSKPLITKETAKTANNTYIYLNKKLIETLDFKFIPVTESIKDSCEYFLKIR